VSFKAGLTCIYILTYSYSNARTQTDEMFLPHYLDVLCTFGLSLVLQNITLRKYFSIHLSRGVLSDH